MARLRASTPESLTITTPKELGTYLRKIRREADLDQRTAAGLAGVGTRFLGDLERGKETLRFGLVLQVLHRLGIQLAATRRGSPRSR